MRSTIYGNAHQGLAPGVHSIMRIVTPNNLTTVEPVGCRRTGRVSVEGFETGECDVAR